MKKAFDEIESKSSEKELSFNWKDKSLADKELEKIKKDILNKDSRCQAEVKNALTSLLSNSEDVCVPQMILGVLNVEDNAMKSVTCTVVREYFKSKVCESNFDLKVLFASWKVADCEPNQCIQILVDMFKNDLDKSQQNKVIIKDILPTMMSVKTEEDIRENFIDVAFSLLDVCNSLDLNVEEFNSLSSDIVSKYVKSISDLRDSGSSNWHKLWIFLIKYLNKKLHMSMVLTNKLLRVVEFAFRNPAYQQRLKGYDCWQELIDNASLNEKYLCSSKQIKLLITPLKAKFSKQEIVISKRFGVFVYLLSKLKSNLVLVLRDFLEFCFGSPSLDSNKIGQIKIIPDTWKTCIAVILEIVGHSDEDNETCIIDKPLGIGTPIINSENLTQFYDIILHSISECIEIMKDMTYIENTKVLECFWTSIINIVACSERDTRRKCLEIISKLLLGYIHEASEFHRKACVIILFNLLVSYSESQLSNEFSVFVEPLLVTSFTVSSTDERYINSLDQLVCVLIRRMDENRSVRKEILESFSTLKVCDANVAFIAKLWKNLISTEKHPDEFTAKYLCWPVLHAHLCPDEKLLDCYQFYDLILKNIPILKLQVLKELEVIFANNPMLAFNIATSLKDVSELTLGEKGIYEKAFKLCSSLLIIPDQNGHRKIITDVLMKHLDMKELTEISDDGVIKQLCTCLEAILGNKEKLCFEKLNKFLLITSVQIRNMYSKYLYKKLVDLSVIVDKSFADTVQSLLCLLSNATIEGSIELPGAFKAPCGRSGRIAKLMKISPSSTQSNSKENNEAPMALKLFGKDLDTFSPLSVKGSQLNNTPKRSKKILKLVSDKPKIVSSINDEESCDFVPIDSEVKLQKDKLTEKQKEALTRRKEDIPALYQDLSQSSQSLSSSNSKYQELNCVVGIVEKTEEKSNTKFKDFEDSVKNPSISNNTTENLIEEKLIINNNEDCGNVKPDDHEEQEKLKKKLKIENELKKLSMNIVGADEFFSVPSKRKRSTSKYVNPTTLQKTNPQKTDIQDDKSECGSEEVTVSHNKGKDNLTESKSEPFLKRDKNRRKTIGSVTELTSVSESKKQEKSRPSSSSSELKSKRNKDVAQRLNTSKTGSEKHYDINNENDIVGIKEEKQSATKADEKNEISIQLHPLEKETSEYVDQKAHKKGTKRKRINTQPSDDDEDIIESSQESFSTDVSRKSWTSKTASSSDNIRTQVLSDNVVNSIEAEQCVSEKIHVTREPDIIEETEPHQSTEPLESQVGEGQIQKPSTQSQDTQTQETQTSDISGSVFQIQLDLPKKPQLTESEQKLSLMDTQSFTSESLNISVCTRITDTDSKNNCDTKQEIKLKEIKIECEKFSARKLTSFMTISSEEDVNKVLPKIENDETVTELGPDLSPIREQPDTNGSIEGTLTPSSHNRNSLSASPVTNGIRNVEDILTPSSHKRNSLPTSPVTTDTPDKTTELLNDTVDISPISSQTGDDSEPNMVSTDTVIMNTVESLVNENKASLFIKTNESGIDVDLKESNQSECPKSFHHKGNNFESPVSHRKSAVRRKSNNYMSPSALRIKKLMSNLKPESNGDELNVKADEEVLTFSREIPSPLAVPKSSILKRKFEDAAEDGPSPCAKRKRVNFSDPCTTSKKVFIKDDYANEGLRFEAKRLFGDFSDDGGFGDLFESSDKFTDTEVETEKSLEVQNPLILRQDRPIYPELVDCKDDVITVLKKATSPLFVTILMGKLRSNNITTVGDLAKLSEADVNKYPFKVPIITNVYNAMDQYYNKIYKLTLVNNEKVEDRENVAFSEEIPFNSSFDDEPENSGQTETQLDDEFKCESNKEPTLSENKDVLGDFRVSLKKLCIEEKAEDICKIFVEAVGKNTIMNVVKSFNVETVDMLNESDFSKLLKHIIDTQGLPRIFELLTDSVESSEEESLYFECMIKHSIEKKPISKLLEKRSLVDIRNGLKECIDQKMFAREDLIEVCLVPLIKSPCDITSYINKLTVVEINDLIVNRLQDSDLKMFMDQIFQSYGDDNVVKVLDKKGIINKCSVKDISNSIIENWSLEQISESFKRCINAQNTENQSIVMIEMFKFISSKLPVSTLTELHIEFLKKIPDMISNPK